MLDGIFEEDEIAFKDLSMAQFLCGRLCIWDRPKIKKEEIKARQYLLKKSGKKINQNWASKNQMRFTRIF